MFTKASPKQKSTKSICYILNYIHLIFKVACTGVEKCRLLCACVCFKLEILAHVVISVARQIWELIN